MYGNDLPPEFLWEPKHPNGHYFHHHSRGDVLIRPPGPRPSRLGLGLTAWAPGRLGL